MKRPLTPDPSVRAAIEILEPLMLQRTSDLPVLPALALEALALSRRANVRMDQLLDVIEREPLLAARVLGVANSAFYSRGMPTTSVQYALVRLGTHAVRDVLTMAVYSSTVFDVPGLSELVRECFDHSVAVARASRELARFMDLDPEVAFLAGLLHDVGYARCLKIARTALAQVEREPMLEAVDALHAAAGGVLARAWSLPAEVVLACERHHTPDVRDYAALVGFVEVSLEPERPEHLEGQRDAASAALGLDADGAAKADAIVAAAPR